MMAIPRLPIQKHILSACLTLLTLALTTACGGGGTLAGGGAPLGFVAPEAFELESYEVDTYLAQDLPAELREDFTDLQQDFERFGIDLENVNQLVIAVLDCCSYRNVGLAGGSRVYVFNGSIDLDAVRDRLEAEGLEPVTYGDYEAWERRTLVESFRGFDELAATILMEEGYLVLGDLDGIRELIHELGRADEDEGDSSMEQVLARVGDGWKASGRLDAQTVNNYNSHCAQNSGHETLCDATAYYTSYGDLPLRTEVVTLYGSTEDAQSESEKTESNFETSGVYEPVDVNVVDLTVEGEFVEATIEHDRPIDRKWTRVY